MDMDKFENLRNLGYTKLVEIYGKSWISQKDAFLRIKTDFAENVTAVKS